MENKDLTKSEETIIEEIEISEALKNEIFYLNRKEKKLFNKMIREKKHFDELFEEKSIEQIKENVNNLYTLIDSLSIVCEEKHNIILGLLSKFKRKEEKKEEERLRTKIEVVGVDESMLDSEVLVEPNKNYKISLRNFPKYTKK